MWSEVVCAGGVKDNDSKFLIEVPISNSFCVRYINLCANTRQKRTTLTGMYFLVTIVSIKTYHTQIFL